MYQNKEFKHRTFKESLSNSLIGFYYIFKHERNARRMFAFAALAIIAAIILRLSLIEWAVLLVTISTVIISEIFNTLVEYLADLFRKKYDLRIKILKDLASAAPLFASFVSIIIGAIIFLPKILKLLS